MLVTATMKRMGVKVAQSLVMGASPMRMRTVALTVVRTVVVTAIYTVEPRGPEILTEKVGKL